MTDRQSQEREDHILDCYALIKERDAEIERLRAALKDIQAKAMQFQPPRFTWFYDRVEEALVQQSTEDK